MGCTNRTAIPATIFYLHTIIIGAAIDGAIIEVIIHGSSGYCINRVVKGEA